MKLTIRKSSFFFAIAMTIKTLLRIFINTINKAVDTMRSSGIEATTVKNETDEYIEYNVRIPKTEGIKLQPA